MPSYSDPNLAAVMLERQVQLMPKNAALRFQLGTALASAGRFAEAAEHLHHAIALNPADAEAYVNLGIVLDFLYRPADALEVFEQALALTPGNLRAQYGAGLVAQNLGRAQLAQTHFEAAMALAPGDAKVLHALVESKRVRDGDALIAHLENRLRNTASYSERERALLHFSLAKVYDDIKRPPDAFKHMTEAHALLRAATYDVGKDVQFMAAMADAYDVATLSRLQSMGNPSNAPLFVVGMPRCGSTLVEQVLASHPRIFGAGEGVLFKQCAADEFPDLGRILQPAVFTRKNMRLIGDAYIDKARELSAGALRIVDKTLDNFLFLGLLHLALPQARIIHVRRDPLDTCLSCYSKSFLANISYTHDLTALGRYYAAYRRLMAHWRDVLPPETMMEVDYETFVADFPAEARRLVGFCGLPWDDRCLDFYRNERCVRTASAYQVRRPLFSSSIGRWRPYAEFLSPLVDALSDARI